MKLRITRGVLVATAALSLGLGACTKPVSSDTPRPADRPGVTKRPADNRASYVIKFHRPVTVGLKFRATSSGRIDSSTAVDGRPIAGRSIEKTWAFEGVVTVKAVHACGKATKIEVKIVTLRATQRGATKELLPKDTLVVGEWTGTSEKFTVNGKLVSKDAGEELGFATSLFDGDTTTSDETFGPGGPKKPGDFWKPNAEKLLATIMRKFKKPSLTPAPADVGGRVTFLAAKKVNGLEVIEVEIKARIDNIVPSLGPIKATAGSVEIGMRGWLPQDPKDLTNDSYAMTMKMHFEGDIGKGGKTAKFSFDYDHSQKSTTIAIP